MRSKEQREKQPLDPVAVYNAIDSRQFPRFLLPSRIKSLADLPESVQQFVQTVVKVHEDPKHITDEKVEGIEQKKRATMDDLMARAREVEIHPFQDETEQRESNRTLRDARETQFESWVMTEQDNLQQGLAAATRKAKNDARRGFSKPNSSLSA